MIARQPLFPLGQTVATPGALDALHAAGQDGSEFLARHHAGDWGDLEDEDKAVNDEAVKCSRRILSAYTTLNGVKVWIITEADRSVTTILMPDEY